MNLPITTGNLVGSRVQDKIADLKYRWAWCGTPARNRTHASQEHFEGKWFGQVVVSADIQALDDIRNGIACREYQDRRPVVFPSESASHFKAVNHGQH